MNMEPQKTQLAVIGGGPGGYAAAFRAADLGVETTLIDLEARPGGTWLYRGCISPKTPSHAAKAITDAAEANFFGITFAPPDINFDKLRTGTRSVIETLTGGLEQLTKARKITYIQGRASFVDSHLLRIAHDSGEDTLLRYDNAILATGSRPAVVENLLLDSPRVMNSTRALEVPDIPRRLLVVGGGYIGLELGSVYAALGSEVTIVEMTPGLLPGADRDLVAPLEARMRHVMKELLFETKVLNMRENSDGLDVTLESAGAGAGEQRMVFDKALVSVGRAPNSSGIGVKATKIQLDTRGFVIVDQERRTADHSIFAIGDLTGQPMLAHKASHEGRVAAEIVAGRRAAFEPKAIPAVVFTDPEVAWCGLTETDAAKTGRPVSVAKFPWGASGRATTLHRPEGLTKIIADPETNVVLGLGIVGANAGELISEGVLAIEMGAFAGDIQFTIHPHPTLGETIMEAAEMIFGGSTHLYRPQAKHPRR